MWKKEIKQLGPKLIVLHWEKGRYQKWHEIKFYRAICSCTRTWIYTILQNFLWIAFWLRTSSETFSWRFPIPERKKIKSKKQSEQKTRTNLPIIWYLLDKRNKQQWKSQYGKLYVHYKSLSLHTCSFSQRQKGSIYLMYLSRSENQASIWAKVTNTVYKKNPNNKTMRVQSFFLCSKGQYGRKS